MTAGRRVLVIGRDGQLARELTGATWPDEWAIEATAPPDLDLTLPDRAAAIVTAAKPDLVINAAAYTNVERAEDDYEQALLLNATGPAAVAAACAKIGVPFLTVSTDYVFDGRKSGPYLEDDAVNPLGAYGRSKAEGEALVRSAQPNHIILRTSWLFSPHGTNFVKTMMRLGAERSEVRIVADQRGRPTAAGDLARAIIGISGALVSGNAPYGNYHVANTGPTTWFDFAKAIFEELAAHGERVPERVVAIATADYPTKAARPANSVLDCSLLERTFGIVPRPWREALRECVDELVAQRRRGNDN